MHKLSEEQLKIRQIVHIDVVNDPIDPSKYVSTYDPLKFHSSKANLGPLGPGWRVGSKVG